MVYVIAAVLGVVGLFSQGCVWQVKNTSFGNEKCNYQYNLIIS